jgi:hypothetical protein
MKQGGWNEEADFKTASLRSGSFTDVREGLIFGPLELGNVHSCSRMFTGVGVRIGVTSQWTYLHVEGQLH